MAQQRLILQSRGKPQQKPLTLQTRGRQPPLHLEKIVRFRETGDAAAAAADADAVVVLVLVADTAAKTIATMHPQNSKEEEVEESNLGN